MPKSITRTYSRHTKDSTLLLGQLIRQTRKQAGLTEQEIADRAGISRGSLQRIEKGHPKCEIGIVFEVATILGIPLFDADNNKLHAHLHHVQQMLTLLPKSIRNIKKDINDDF